MKTPHTPRSGFTLIEMLVVIAIIALLAAILVPTVNGALEKAKRAQCASSLRQVGIAIMTYTTEHDTYIPTVRSGGWGAGIHWIEQISPYLGEEVADIKTGESVAAITRACPVWKADLGPTKPGYGMNPYPGAYSARFPTGMGWDNFGKHDPSGRNRVYQIDEFKNPSTTILVGDSVDWHLLIQNNDWWLADNAWGYYSGHPDRHKGSANYLMADGSVAGLMPDDALARLRNPNQ
jgi:general secretion pathway protein G